MNEELMTQPQEMDLERLLGEFLGDILGELLNKLLNGGGDDAEKVSDAYEQIQLYNNSKNDTHLNNAIGLLEQATKDNCWYYTWAKRNVCLTYCYAYKERYKECFTAIMEVINIKVDTLTLNKDEIQELKTLSASFGFELYQEITQNLHSENEELKQQLNQLKSEKAELDQQFKQLDSEKKQLKKDLDEIKNKNTDGNNNPPTKRDPLLIVMCVLSFIGIIISLYCLLSK